MSHLKIFNLLQKSLWKLCLTFNMLKHNISDLFMLNPIIWNIWIICIMCCETWPYVYRERDTCCRNTSHAPPPPPFISWNFSLTVLAAISCMNVNLFCSLSDNPYFCCDMIPFHYFSANSIAILFHHAAQYHRSRCFTKAKGLGKRGQPESWWGNLIFTKRLPDGQPEYFRSC